MSQWDKWNEKEDGGLFDKVPVLMFLICLVIIFTLYGTRLKILRTAKTFIEDGVVISNLASLVVDENNYINTTFYSTSGSILDGEQVITEPLKSYNLLKDSMKKNLELDDYYKSKNTELIDNFVILKYMIYNVRFKRDEHNNIVRFNEDGTEKEDCQYIEIITINKDGIIENITNVYDIDNVFTENGVKVERTTTYVDVGFTVKNIDNSEMNCHYENSVQVVIYKE